MKTLKLKRIGVLSAAIFQGAAMAAIALLAVLVFLVVGGIFVGTSGGEGLEGFLTGGPMALLVAPIIYGVMGFIGGAIGASIYNIVAKMTGGIEYETEAA